MDRRRRLDHAGGLELDVPSAEMLEHARAAPEKYRHEVDGDLIDKPGLDVLSPDIRSRH
jgi:hypothetical protein